MKAPADSPRGVLAEPPHVRIQYFKDFAVAHPLLVEAKDRLLEAITESAPNSLILVSGPTGVGKTTLLARVKQLLFTRALQEINAEPGRLPVVAVEAIPPESRVFSWRSHFKRILLEMNDPLPNCKRRLTPDNGPGEAAFPNDRSVTADYHYAVEQALRYRRPYALLIDEAQHLFALTSGRKMEDQLNVLKSLANRCNTVHVLCGTYELLRIRNLSSQLSRRSIDIHFPRYDVTNAPERHTFATILRTFAEQMPLLEPPDFAKDWEYLYERSLGCIGILKDWLVRGLATAIGESAPTLTLRHLERHALSGAQCAKLVEDATRGESQFREDPGVRSRLRLQLGLSEPADTANTTTTGSVHRQPYRRPGQRSPKRDIIGAERIDVTCHTV